MMKSRNLWLISIIGMFVVLLLVVSCTPGKEAVAGEAVARRGYTSVCGNGNVDDAEQCDDGNLVDGDGCSSTCQVEQQEEQQVNASNPVCGNGVLETVMGEQCDDGNLVNGDGCSLTCQVELKGNGSGNFSGSNVSNVSLGKPDLVVRLGVVQQVSPGSKMINVYAVVKNNGTANTSKLGTGTRFTAYQPQLVNQTVATQPLVAGQETVIWATYECSQNHQLEVWADATWNEAESNEFNNFASGWITCPAVQNNTPPIQQNNNTNNKTNNTG